MSEVSGRIKIMDVNALSYLYTKLKNNIDDYQNQYTDTLNQATNILTDAANNYATKTYVDEAVAKVSQSGTEVPETLEDGSVFYVYEE
jgi:hypothetical protein